MNDIVFAGKHMLTHNVSRHKHKNWELIYCTSESGRFVFSNMEIEYSEGDIVIIPPELPHENVSANGFTNIFMNIENTTMSFPRPTLVRDDANGSLLHLFSDAYYLFCSDPERRAALLSGYGQLIVQHIVTARTSLPKNRAVVEISQSIAQNYANPDFDLDDALQSVPYCYDHFCRLFRQEMSTTPHKYLTDLRLQAAADLLLSGYNSNSVSEIAHMCGFKDPLYFSRLFKKKYDASPSLFYRRKVLEQSGQGDSDSQKIILPE